MDAACLPHLAAEGFAGQILVLVAVLHLVWTVAVLDWKHSVGPLVGNDVAVVEDFYNIGHDGVTGGM